jgi:acetylglutamate kinase
VNDQSHEKLITSPDKPVLIKLGGSVLHNDSSIMALCQDIKTIMSYGLKIIIVHGGSKAINEALNIHGIESVFIQGLRKTTFEAMKVIEMVLCGQVNQTLVRNLNQIGVAAFGLSGASNQTIFCEQLSEEYGFVGEIKAVNTALIQYLLSAKERFIPVIASLGIDKAGHALNINADLAASCLANALRAQKLIYITDQEGIYNHEGNVLTQVTEEHLLTLIQKSIVKDGMLIKAKAILQSMRQGLNHILIANGHKKNILLDALLHKKSVGTLCMKNANLVH